MKLCRFSPLDSSPNDAAPSPLAGVIESSSVFEIRGELWGARERTGRKWPLDKIKFLAPSVPTKIVCVGRNYRDHIAELSNPVPKEPLTFFKPPSSIIPTGEAIVLPPVSQNVHYEGELALIIGRRCFHLRPSDDYRDYIAGYTTLNDITARDLQKTDNQWTRVKGFDTFCPLGPVMETGHPSPETSVETAVNGVRKQSAPISEMIFSLDVIIRWIAQVMTLEPGDVIATGTPAGVGPLAAGDVVEVSISGIGMLRNPVIAQQD
jgi:2-keto-4-pentenoate hydratase/2-oxohepta-3-ene-1,7-dioic acid hydratase in catechol pathway